MKTLKLLVLALVLGILAAGAGLAADPKPQTLCPVLGGNIDQNVYADHQGNRIYFCCQGCDAEFRQNPEKYMKKLQEQGVTLEKSPAAK
jgi:YHS domain-containing protein